MKDNPEGLSHAASHPTDAVAHHDAVHATRALNGAVMDREHHRLTLGQRDDGRPGLCAGALLQARVARVVYGAADPKAGALGSLFSLGDDARLNHRFEVKPGVLAADSAARLTAFFAKLRAAGER